MPQPRSLRAGEVESLIGLIAPIFGFDSQYPRERMLSDLRKPVSRRDAMVIGRNGKVLSHIRVAYDTVSVYGCRFKVASIGGVATDPQHRARGYAGAILSLLIRQMEARGAKLLIVSGDRSLYRRAHCVSAGRLYEAALGPGFGGPTRGVGVRRVGPEQWPLLAPLHQAESVRFVRPIGFLSSRPFWWDCEYPEIWLIERDKKPIAYLALALGWPREPSSRKRVVWDYAGSRPAILEALPAIFAAGSFREITLRLTGYDHELVYLLRKRGLALEERPMSGTHRLIDLPGLMKALRPYLTERLPQADLRGLAFDQMGSKCVCRFGGERAEMPLSQAAPLVLGGPGAPAIRGELGRVLSTIVPIPLPLPGFNYV